MITGIPPRRERVQGAVVRGQKNRRVEASVLAKDDV